MGRSSKFKKETGRYQRQAVSVGEKSVRHLGEHPAELGQTDGERELG